MGFRVSHITIQIVFFFWGLLVQQWCREHNIFVNMWYLSFSIISYTVCMHMCVFILPPLSKIFLCKTS
jgi:hypothetical protein